MEDPIYLRTALNALKRKNDVANETMKDLAKQILILRGVIVKQEIQIKNIINSHSTKQKIINSAVERANKTNNEYLIEITELRREVKCLSQ